MTIESIIEGCRRGDAEARRELYQRYAPEMFALIRRYVKVRAAAEDVFHDGFIMAYTKIESYRGEGSFEGWLRRIFVNAALSHLRSTTVRRTVESDVGDLPPGVMGGAPPEVLSRLTQQDLMRVMERLPDGYRAVINLHVVEGYSHAEIAEMLDVSEGTSRSQYLRGRMKLVELIEEYEREKESK